MNAIVPIPTLDDVSVRPATLADIPFIDALQKENGRALGFMAEPWIVNKIEREKVLIAEESLTTDDTDDTDRKNETNSSVLSVKSVVQSLSKPVGYVMGSDRYFKRDEVGIVHQLAVVPGRRRSLVGATLLKALFDASAYGVRLYCCWCAQDLEANRFWESIGFVPLAFRTGSHGKKTTRTRTRTRTRTHIFWQKRIREADATTPWWFPAKTDAGALRADRLVFPIPPGKHWSDEMPILVPKESLALGHSSLAKDKGPRTKDKAPVEPMSRQYGPPGAEPEPAPAPVAIDKPKREKKPKAKADPKLVAAARELRDRYLEQVNSGAMLLESAGKYDVARALPAMPTTPLLAA